MLYLALNCVQVAFSRPMSCSHEAACCEAVNALTITGAEGDGGEGGSGRDLQHGGPHMAAHMPIPAPCSKAVQSNCAYMVAQLNAPFVDGKHSWSHDGVLSPGFVAGHDLGRSVAPVERHRTASSQGQGMFLPLCSL